MKFCASLAFTNPEHYCELAVLAEEHAWDALVLSDHVVHPQTINRPYPYTEAGSRRWQAYTDWPDPWVMIGALFLGNEFHYGIGIGVKLGFRLER